ncbi:hypothetical protein J6590_028266 [Homalodisca vitripennis]|nr:hypothetical protein J6590_028266 [Homalodisca vitripennis]
MPSPPLNALRFTCLPSRFTSLHLNHVLDLPCVSDGAVKPMCAFVNSFYDHTEATKVLKCDITLDHRLTVQLEHSQHISTKCDEVHYLPSDANFYATPHEIKGSYSSSKPLSPLKVHFSPRDVTMLATSAPRIAHETETSPSSFVCKLGHRMNACSVFVFRKHAHRERHNRRYDTLLNFHLITLNVKGPLSGLVRLNNAHPNPMTCTSQKKDPLYRCKSGLYTTLILCTTLVKITASNESVYRAPFDPGSMSDSINEHATAQLLGMCRLHSHLAAVGFSETSMPFIPAAFPPDKDVIVASSSFRVKFLETSKGVC